MSPCFPYHDHQSWRKGTTMTLPGFEAEASIFRSQRHYATLSHSPWSAPETAARVVPSQIGHCIPDPETCSTTCFSSVTGSSQTTYHCLAPWETCCPSPDGKTFTCCAYGQKCENGTCSWICGSGLTYCQPGVCANTSSDPNNCGVCGNVCHGGHCSNGSCICGPGLTNCNGTCVLLSTDSNNCGSCGHKCPPGMVCNFGFCESASQPSKNTVCDPNTGQCSTTTTTHIQGECTGVNGPKSCILVLGSLQCCASNIFFGEYPYVNITTSCNSDKYGNCLSPPVSDSPGQGCGVC